MTPLSPAAQAIWDAFNEEEAGVFVDYGDKLAAAFRAAAAQIEPTQQDRAEQPEIHSQVFFNGVAWSAVSLRSIASELAGHQPTP